MTEFASKFNQKIAGVLKRIGFEESTKIADTLQGSTWRASKTNNNTGLIETSVIKVTNQYLHQNSMSVVDNKVYAVSEDILLEQSILKFLTQQENCPESMVKFERFFRTNTAYYLVMSDGGNSFFDFLQKAHELIRSDRIDLTHWHNVCQIIFKQMVECVQFLHSKNVCHFDISLENFLINDVQIEIVEEFADKNKHKIRFVTDDIQIKLCDFGLAQLFTKRKCLSNKYVGKVNYKSPEVIAQKKGFDAKKNDIWCLGVCLWMMLTGSNLWDSAEASDIIFAHVINGYLKFLIKKWNMQFYVDSHALQLFEGIFKYETNRISLKQMKKYKWLNIN